MRAWLILLTAACGTDTEPDAVRYTRIISDASPHSSTLRDCQQLSRPDLRGDCELVVARRVADAEQRPPETHCDQIDGEAWEAECFFMAAEDHNSDGDVARAAALCLRSALFTDHCAQHLWQRTLRGFTWHNGSRDFAQRLPAAQKLYSSWAPLLEDQTDFPVRFWRRYYEGGFERSRDIDLAACEPLPEDDRRRCRTAGIALLSRRIQEIIQLPRAATEFCSSAPNADALTQSGPPQLSARSDPDLDRAIANLQQRYCGDNPASETHNMPFTDDQTPSHSRP